MDKKIAIKKKIILILLTLLTIAVIGILSAMYIYRPQVVIKEDITVEVNDNVPLSLLFESTNNIKQVLPFEIDTTTLGEKQIDVTVESLFLYKKTYHIKVNVVDRQAPIINGEVAMIVPLNTSIETIISRLDISDNYDKKEDIKIEVSQNYNLNLPGKYYVDYLLMDTSNNQNTYSSYIIVEIEGSQAEYFTTSKGFLAYQKDGLTYVDGVLVVNKTYSKPEDYGDGLTTEFNNAFAKMKAAAADDGCPLYIVSGFRTNDFQSGLFYYYVSIYGWEETLLGSAMPGHSEHETGLAADLNRVAESFKYTDSYAWLMENCYKYGFILRYPEGLASETGYDYEPWHYRYVGVDLATKLWNEGQWISLENYFGITSQYQD